MNTAVLNTKIDEVKNKNLNHAKYITTQEFKKFMAENITAKLKKANIGIKNDYDKKLTSFNRKISSNKTKFFEV